MTYKVIHAMASYHTGGAECYFVRLMEALHSDSRVELLPIVKKGSWLSKRLKELNIPHKTVFFGGKIDFITPLRLRWMCKAFKPDVVQTWLNRAAGMFPKVDAVMASRLGGYYYYKHFLKSEYMIGNTEDICRYIKEGPWEDEKVLYFPNFVDEAKPFIEKEGFLKSHRLPTDKKFIIMAGRLHHIKGFDVVIPLLNKLPDNYHIIIAGEGDEKQALDDLIAQHNLTHRVHLVGWVDSISEFYSASDIFVIPSRHEPLGNVVLEGWAHKLPVISSRSEGPVVLITDNENGLLVDIDDEDGFLTALQKVISSPELAHRISKNGFNTLQEKFSKQAVIEQNINFYEQVTGK